MGFFSNIIKKIGKFVASVFRDVEKPVKETEKTVKETVKVFEDTGLKAFRGFQKFIEAPVKEIEKVIEEPEEEIEEYFRKILKMTVYSNGAKESWYSLTFEDNKINRQGFLLDKMYDNIGGTSLDNRKAEFGYDDEETTTNPPFIYPDFEVDFE